MKPEEDEIDVRQSELKTIAFQVQGLVTTGGPQNPIWTLVCP